MSSPPVTPPPQYARFGAVLHWLRMLRSPAMSDDLVYSSAARLAALISTRQLSPVELVQAYLDRIDRLEREVFGPILHVVRYAADELEAVLDAINATGYGLTLGIHSRIDQTVRYIVSRMRVGNVYVNRNMIGAVVGTQPFGGANLSGTGPKAGGPNYLHRFTAEQVVTVNTAAAGGNASLLAAEEG